jgi:hypothetical protein
LTVAMHCLYLPPMLIDSCDALSLSSSYVIMAIT